MPRKTQNSNNQSCLFPLGFRLVDYSCILQNVGRMAINIWTGSSLILHIRREASPEKVMVTQSNSTVTNGPHIRQVNPSTVSWVELNVDYSKNLNLKFK